MKARVWNWLTASHTDRGLLTHHLATLMMQGSEPLQPAHVGTWRSCRDPGTRGNCKDQRRHGGGAGIQALRLQTCEASTPTCAVNGFALPLAKSCWITFHQRFWMSPGGLGRLRWNFCIFYILIAAWCLCVVAIISFHCRPKQCSLVCQ